ncbi:hypothetical protein BV898_15942 [Hypsibius exemplaris]|uniref:Uncharacterized protein n=1 Tax=Hypsibius exemplaris TaxID=2072580 RepID=A0A9X6NIZ3_HYPEX|nr:hypothetical protein BV898_15942 [Hypsibius exemplaris]
MLDSSEYSWLKSYLHNHPCLTDFSQNGFELWALGGIRYNLESEEAPNDFCDRNSDPHHCLALSGTTNKAPCVKWFVRCGSSVPSANSAQLANLRKSHPIALL